MAPAAEVPRFATMFCGVMLWAKEVAPKARPTTLFTPPPMPAAATLAQSKFF
jgi:hypothetical protein